MSLGAGFDSFGMLRHARSRRSRKRAIASLRDVQSSQCFCVCSPPFELRLLAMPRLRVPPPTLAAWVGPGSQAICF